MRKKLNMRVARALRASSTPSWFPLTMENGEISGLSTCRITTSIKSLALHIFLQT